MAATGTATIDFGSTPTDEGSVTITGQVDLQAADHIEAFVMRDSTVDNPVEAHSALAEDINLICEQDAANDRFFIYARTGARVTGTFKVRWAYSGTAAIGNISGGAAGGVLSGTYPDPGFAQDMATQAELDALAKPPQARINKSAVQSIANATTTKVSFDTSDWDRNHGGTPHFDDANDRLIARVDGLYLCAVTLGFSLNATGYREIILWKNGNGGTSISLTRGLPIAGATAHWLTCTGDIELAVGEFIEVWALQTSTAPLNISNSSFMSFHRVGSKA